MKRSLALCLLTISAPALALAQDTSGAITLGFGEHEVSDIDQGLSTASLDGRVNMTFASGMTFGVNAGYLDLGIDGAPIDIDATFVGLDVGHKMASGLSVGAYAEQLTADAGLGIDLSLKSIGATAGYETGNLDFGAFLGRTTVSPDITGLEADTLGLSAKYAAMEKLTLGGSFQRASLSAGGSEEIDVDLIGLAGAYDITEQFSLFGGASRTTIDEADLDITTMGLGVGYDLNLGGMSSMVSLELARTDLSAFGGGTDLDTVRLGFTLPLGGAGTEAPLNSVADSIFNPRHGAVNAALTGAF